MKRPVAYLITPHGFGHAARASAVMQAMRAVDPEVHFEILTRVPRWFFDDSLDADFGYREVLTDIGLVQDSPLREDVAATVDRLREFCPFDEARVAELAGWVRERECRCVVCDIAPLGIAVAHAAGLPAILVENFTWDWIYQGYVDADRRLLPLATYLGNIFAQADYHIQTEPVCLPAAADLVTPPVSRAVRQPPSAVREQLQIPREAHAVLITMGGIPERPAFVEQLAGNADAYFVIPGAGERVERIGHAILLPHRSSFFHPDLMHACDAVVGKSGYSTVAEAYAAGIPFGYVARARFRESDTMAEFITHRMSGMEILEADLQSGQWLASLPDLLALPRVERRGENGAVQIARFIAGVAAEESVSC